MIATDTSTSFRKCRLDVTPVRILSFSLQRRMLFLGALLLPFLSSYLSEVVWDPTDPRCERCRDNDPMSEIIGTTISWDKPKAGLTDTTILSSTHCELSRTIVNVILVNRYLQHTMSKLLTIESTSLAHRFS